MLVAALLAITLAGPVADSTRPATADGEWTTLVAYDEVQVEVDASRMGGAGPLSVWVRWRFADRAVSPASWDQGVRYSIDAVEVSCADRATRTLVSTAYTADGSEVAAASYADENAAWRRYAAESMGGRIAAGICAVADARTVATARGTR